MTASKSYLRPQVSNTPPTLDTEDKNQETEDQDSTGSSDSEDLQQSSFGVPYRTLVDNTQLVYHEYILPHTHIHIHVRPNLLPRIHSICTILDQDLQDCIHVLPSSVHALVRRTHFWINDVYAMGPCEDPIRPNNSTAHHHPAWLVGARDRPEKALGIEVYSWNDFECMRLHWNGCGLLLHELCHLIHQQVMGLEDPSIEKLYQSAQDSGLYQRMARRDWAGKTQECDLHYGMINAKEFFAEFSVTYLATGYSAWDKCLPRTTHIVASSPPLMEPMVVARVNKQTHDKAATLDPHNNNNNNNKKHPPHCNKFFPFTRGQLKRYDAALEAAMDQVWTKRIAPWKDPQDRGNRLLFEDCSCGGWFFSPAKWFPRAKQSPIMVSSPASTMEPTVMTAVSMGYTVPTVITRNCNPRNKITPTPTITKQSRQSIRARMWLSVLIFGVLGMQISSAESSKEALPLHVQIDTSRQVSRTNDRFLCVTMDWWPGIRDPIWTDKSFWAMDLEKSELLRNAMKALSPVYLRLGGSLQDYVKYTTAEPEASTIEINNSQGRSLRSTEKEQKQSQPWPNDWNDCFPFRASNQTYGKLEGGCLHLHKLKEMHEFCVDLGCQLVFGLSYLHGRKLRGEREWYGSWDPSNAQLLLEYAVKHNLYTLVGYELGNEVDTKGILARFESDVFAHDLKRMRDILEETYSSSSLPTPLLLGIDTAHYNTSYTNALFDEMPVGTLDGFTYHIYSLGCAGTVPEEEVTNNILNPTFLDEYRYLAAQVQLDLKAAAPQGTQIWLGEGGGACRSGMAGITDSYISAFWYLDQLGQAALHGHQTMCRQTFVGGRYALLQDPIDGPLNPDYYNALLWRKLMGPQVLSVATSNTYLRAYAHCTNMPQERTITLLLLNLDRHKSMNIELAMFGISPNIKNDQDECDARRLEYRMSEVFGDLHGKQLQLNGKLLYPINHTIIPPMEPLSMSVCDELVLKPMTYAFLVLPHVLPVCNNDE